MALRPSGQGFLFVMTLRVMGPRLAIAGLVLPFLCLSPRSSLAVPSLPPGFAAIEVGPSGEWDTPVGIAIAPDGRVFVIEKRGRVHVVENDVRVEPPFLQLDAEVLNNGDRGLLGIALDPGFAANGRLYLLYSVDPDGDGVDDEEPAFGRLTRYTASASNRNRADPASRVVLLGETWRTGITSCFHSHAVGALRFGDDGSLLLSAGDAASASFMDDGGSHAACFGSGRTDPAEDIGAFRSQWIGSLAGKVLRLDPSTGGGLSTNPYYTGNPLDAASRVWVYGLRNPFRFCVRPGTGSPDPTDGLPGTLYIGDVGWKNWEEVTVTSPEGGDNHGWPCREGFGAHAEYSSGTPAHHGCGTIGSASNPGPVLDPLASWHHTTASLSTPPGLSGNCVGAASFYEGSTYPAQYRGACFFADYERNWIKAARVDAQDNLIEVLDFATDAEGPVDLVADPASGDLHYVSIRRNQIWRIRYDPSNRPPVASGSASPASGTAPLAVQFSSAGSSDPDGDPLSWRWSFGDGTSSTAANPSHTYLSSGSYTVALTVSDGRGGQGSALMTVEVGGTSQGGNTAPAATIIEPAADSFFLYGSEIQLRGTASDQEDALSTLQFDWEVLLHHNTHVHPGWLLLEGTTAKFVPHDHDDGTGTWFEIVLRVRDPGGLVGTDRVSIFPDDQPLIIDNGNPGTSFTGTWSVSGGAYPYGASSLYSNTAGKTYTYTFQVPAPGPYKVYAWWTTWSSRSTAAPYTIAHGTGSSTVQVNQFDPATEDHWNFLGLYHFGSTARVTLTGVGNGKTVCADAVCLIRGSSGNAPPVARIDSVSPNPADFGETVSFIGHGEDDGTVTAHEWRSNIDGPLSDDPSFSSSSLTPGLHTIYYRVQDDDGVWSTEVTVVLDVMASGAPEEVILDNGQPGTTAVGGWSISGGSSPYGANALYSKSTGATYTFRPVVPRSGTYDVYAWWTVLASRTTAAPYTISHAGGTSTVTTNQRLNGGRWNLLGTYDFGSTGAAIKVSSVAGGFSTCADAVRLVFKTSGTGPVERILDDGSPGTSSTGSWLVSGGADPYGASSVYAKNTVSTYTYSFTLPQAGSYEVFAWWTVLKSRSSSVNYEITHAGGKSTVVRSQKVNGGKWNSLGVMTFGSTAIVTVLARADGDSYSADAVRLVLTP
jgi:PKD repeat protein/glucose/arabinose dehydrogenase